VQAVDLATFDGLVAGVTMLPFRDIFLNGLTVATFQPCQLPLLRLFCKMRLGRGTLVA